MMELSAKTSKPLQIVHVDLHSNEVRVNQENLKVISDNLKNAKVERISVVSVMGAYRTGKSFLLDLFLRYLEYGETNPEGAPAGTEDTSRASTSSSSSLAGAPPDDRETGKPFEVPAWMRSAGKLSEASDGTTPRDGIPAKHSPRGFSWRGGANRCTEGMWR
ncbi:unnamed protein product [Amoebophrya sp. A25]|nr:unnamed protein product [Amoebophrya sp. A25]|eukprot:GSA25T00002695001.1